MSRRHTTRTLAGEPAACLCTFVERLLDDPERRQVEARVQRPRRALDVQRHRHAGRAGALDQARQLRQPGLRRQLGVRRRPRAARPAAAASRPAPPRPSAGSRAAACAPAPGPAPAPPRRRRPGSRSRSASARRRRAARARSARAPRHAIRAAARARARARRQSRRWCVCARCGHEPAGQHRKQHAVRRRRTRPCLVVEIRAASPRRDVRGDHPTRARSTYAATEYISTKIAT